MPAPSGLHARAAIVAQCAWASKTHSPIRFQIRRVRPALVPNSSPLGENFAFSHHSLPIFAALSSVRSSCVSGLHKQARPSWPAVASRPFPAATAQLTGVCPRNCARTRPLAGSKSRRPPVPGAATTALPSLSHSIAVMYSPVEKDHFLPGLIVLPRLDCSSAPVCRWVRAAS